MKHDDDLVVIRPVNLWKDHLKGDSINAFPLHDTSDELQPQSFLLRSRVR